MRDYVLSQEADSRIKKSELWARINGFFVNNTEGIPNFEMGGLLKPDVEYITNIVREWGFYETLPAKFKWRYLDVMKSILNDKWIAYWTVNRLWLNSTIEAKLRDIVLFSWIYPSFVMSPEEIWNHEKFGFGTTSDLVISVSTYIINLISWQPKDWLTWQTTNNWRTFVSKYTWDHMRDPRLIRTEITSYPTINPFWDNSSVRPHESADNQCVWWNQNTEAMFLVSVLRWIEQCNITSDVLIWWIEWIFELISKMSVWHLTCFAIVKRIEDIICPWQSSSLDSLSSKISTDHKKQFTKYKRPLPELWSIVEVKYWPHIMGGWINLAQVKWRNLLFTQDTKLWEKFDGQRVHCELYPEEADDILKWIIYQAYRWLWRTSILEILSILAFYLKNKQDLLDGSYWKRLEY